MRITNINASFSVNKTLANLLLLYIVSIIFTYPYGVPINEDNYVRIPDLFAVFIGAFAIIVWSVLGRDKFNFQSLIPIIPFFMLEVALPVLGGDFLSPFRVVLLYLPVATCCLCLGVLPSLKLDRKVNKLFQLATIVNLAYGIIQLIVYLGILPESLLISTTLENFVADRHFSEVQGLRVAGFFVNTTGLSVFGIVAMSYFLSKYKYIGKFYYLIYSMLALMLILLSTSRAAYVAGVAIVLFNILSSNLNKSIKTITIIIVTVSILLFVLSYYLQIDYQEFFYRFIRIREEGLEEDFSWQTRVEVLWPAVIAGMKNYPLGTLVPSYKIFRLIDSGYLTYYSQGKWIFIAGLMWFYFSTIFNLFKAKKIKQGWSANFLFCLLIYIIAAMVVSNPMRSSTMIFGLIYGLWFLSIENKLVTKKYYLK